MAQGYSNPQAVVHSGQVVQEVYAQDGAVATTTTVMPGDDSIPQNTEGGEFITAAITPTKTANLLRIDVVINAMTTATTGNALTVALFQDSTVDSIGLLRMNSTINTMHNMGFTHWMAAGTLASTTFKVRVGSAAAGTVTVNGYQAARRGGGVLWASITITEYEV